VRQDTQVTLPLTRRVRSAPQRRVQEALVPREGALRLPALPVLALGEPLLHLPAKPCLGPLPPLVAAVDRDGRRADVQVLPAEPVVLLAVERRVGEHPIPGHPQRRLEHRRPELRAVVARADRDGGGGEEVAGGVTGDRQLGPERGGLLFPGPREEVMGGVAALQAGGIDGRLGLGADQAARLGARGGLPEEGDDLPFFRSLLAA